MKDKQEWPHAGEVWKLKEDAPGRDKMKAQFGDSVEIECMTDNTTFYKVAGQINSSMCDTWLFEKFYEKVNDNE